MGDFAKTITQTFQLSPNDEYVYRADSFAMTLAEINAKVDKLKYRYQSHGQQIEVVCSESCRSKPALGRESS